MNGCSLAAKWDSVEPTFDAKTKCDQVLVTQMVEVRGVEPRSSEASASASPSAADSELRNAGPYRRVVLRPSRSGLDPPVPAIPAGASPIATPVPGERGTLQTDELRF